MPVLVFLIISIVVLLSITVLLALVTIGLRLLNIRRGRRRARLEHEWAPLASAVLLDGSPASVLQDRIAVRDRGFFLEYLARHARGLAGPELDRVRLLAAPYLPELRVPSRMRDPDLRAHAIHILGLLAPADDLGELVVALDDAAPIVAMVAARALVRRGRPDHADAVLRRLARFSQWSPRYVSSLLAPLGPEISPMLRRALVDAAAPPEVREIAADTLRKRSDPVAADDALALLEREPNLDVRGALMRYLSVVAEPRHAGRLRPLCGSADDAVRAQAVRVLARVGTEDDRSGLFAFLADPSPWVAIQAAWGMAMHGRREDLRRIAENGHPRSALARQVLQEAA